eukprot:355355-Chlamydomonas_euryale.AAC.1
MHALQDVNVDEPPQNAFTGGVRAVGEFPHACGIELRQRVRHGSVGRRQQCHVGVAAVEQLRQVERLECVVKRRQLGVERQGLVNRLRPEREQHPVHAVRRSAVRRGVDGS